MKKSTKLILGISVALVLMIACAFTVFATEGQTCPHNDYYYDSYYDEYYCYDCGTYFDCPHNDSYCVSGNEYYCYDCGEYYYDYDNGFDDGSDEYECPHNDSYCVSGDEYYCYDCGEFYFDSSYDSYEDYTSSSSEQPFYIILGIVVLTLLAPWIILVVIIFGLFLPTLLTIISTLIVGIILFIVGAIIFILTPVIVIAAPILVLTLL